MKNAKQHKDIKFVKTEKGMNHLVIRTKLSNNKSLFRNFVSNRNKNSKCINELTSLFRPTNV